MVCVVWLDDSLCMLLWMLWVCLIGLECLYVNEVGSVLTTWSLAAKEAASAQSCRHSSTVRAKCSHLLLLLKMRPDF